METENYAKATLQALNRDKYFAVGVLGFLMEKAIIVSQDCYHYGNSTLFYTMELPEQREEVRVHINLDLVAKNRQALTQDLAEIITEFPEFSLRQDDVVSTRVMVPIPSN